MIKSKCIPLVVDLDGTFYKTDSLWEGFFQLIHTQPHRIAAVLHILFSGNKVQLKQYLAPYSLRTLDSWPLNTPVYAYMQGAQSNGRPLYLATGADISIAEAVSRKLGCFEGVLATSGDVNLKGEVKAEKLRKMFGEKCFDYIGNSLDDLPVWATCREAVVMSMSQSLRAKVVQINPRCRMLEVASPPLPAVYMQAARLGQWLKNILVAVPLLLSHKFTLPVFLVISAAFFSFSLCASAFYIVNDLLDLTSDRRHATKKGRPFASGILHPAHGLALAGLLLVVSLSIALLLSGEFFAVIACYALLTLLYSGIFKAHLILDAVCLGILYTLRIAAGVAALQADMSSWVLGFSFFIFLGLAFIKRLAEIQRSAAFEQLPGRSYRFSDGSVIECMAAASGFSALIILSLYIDSINAVRLYTTPQFLWVLCPVILYWYCRLLVLTHRDEMHDDPVFFVIRDRASIACGVVTLFVILYAI
jgi:4-hydroxybenzoate polyprenyltransferase